MKLKTLGFLITLATTLTVLFTDHTLSPEYTVPANTLTSTTPRATI
jgi:hypothetical protein